MKADSRRFHGGRCPEGFIDFSSNTNPLGPPQCFLEALKSCVDSGAIARYPDYSYSRLREALASWYSVSPEGIVPLNGAAEGLQLIPTALRVKTLITAEPTFGDHECLCRLLGIELLRITYSESGDCFSPPPPEDVAELVVRAEKPAAVIVSDPNNPTGSSLPSGWIDDLISYLPRESLLIIDAAFKEFEGFLRLDRFDGVEGLAFVLSLTKVYAVPGLRIGFTYSPDPLIIKSLNMVRQAWNVNGLAECVITEAFTRFRDELMSYLRITREVVRCEREFLASGLRGLGLKVFKSSAPYLLVKHSGIDAGFVEEFMLGEGICVRNASSFYGLGREFTRVAVRLRDDNNALLNAFSRLVSLASKDS